MRSQTHHPIAALRWLERRARVTRRLERVRAGLWPATQAALAAALAWAAAGQLLDVRRPLFAPVAAVIALGFTTGRRGRQAVQIVIGVAVGILVADLVATYVGLGAVQIGLVVLLAMPVALLFGESSTFVVQAGVTALLVAATRPPSGGLSPGRLVQGAIGGAVALVFSQLLFPVDPLRRAGDAVSRLATRIAETLERAADAAGDGEELAAALGSTEALAGAIRDLDEAVDIAAETVRHAPIRRRSAGEVRRYREVSGHLRFAAASAASVVRLVERGGDRAQDAGVANALRSVARATRACVGDDPGSREALQAAEQAVADLPDTSLTSAALRSTLASLRSELEAIVQREDV